MTTKITQKRAAFEAWHERLYGRRPVRKGGGYAATAHTDRWTIWLACRAAVEADCQGRMPSDDELLQLASECCDSTDATGEEPKFTTDESMLRFARALLSRYSSDRLAKVRCNHCGWHGADADLVRDVAADEPDDGAADVCPQCKRIGDLQDIGQPAASAEPRPDEYDYFVDWYDKEAPDESEVRNFDMARHAWLAGVRFADLFPAADPVAQEPVARDWPSIQSAIDEYLDGYELIGEPGDHTPTEFEKFLLTDAIAGLLDDEKFLGLFAAPVAAQAQPSGDVDGLTAVYDAFGIGSAARTQETLLANIENAIRRSRCLSAIERGLTVETPPDPDEGDDEPGEECLLRWGAEPEGYVEHFQAALKEFGYTLAAQAQPVASLKPDMQRESQRGAESGRDREDAHDIEAAAKTLAECMDYPWEPMPEKGREAMRNHAKRVIDAARAAKGADHG